MVKIIECPRDAMQGIAQWIPTADKVRYINSLLKVGFDTLDFGSFVSEKAIPQLKDTSEVLRNLDLSIAKSKLLAIVANQRGAEAACQYGEIQYLGYPFSISETFQLRNTNATLDQSLSRLAEISELCSIHRKKLVIYISMAFGNPYGDNWHPDIAVRWCGELHSKFDIDIIALSDTIGVAKPETISSLFSSLIPSLKGVEFGAHFHTTAETWQEKIESAYNAGCRRFDGALKGFGGCPMAADELTGNMPTENMVSYFQSLGLQTNLDLSAMQDSLKIAQEIFPG